MVRRFDDEDGQDDGDNSSAWSVGAGAVSPFAKSMSAQPWLRGNSPPWHLWGNTQQITVPVQVTGAASIRSGNTTQLLRIAYKRPETWHWLFSARLIRGPVNTPTFFTTLDVYFELTTGIGRSAVRMHFENSTGYQIHAFERFRFKWGPLHVGFPTGAHVWSTQSFSPTRFFDTDAAFAEGPPVTEIVAQDLQLQAQCVGITVPANVAAAGQNVVVEVSAMFAPKSHIRPDWYSAKGPLEQQFPGDEVGGT